MPFWAAHQRRKRLLDGLVLVKNRIGFLNNRHINAVLPGEFIGDPGCDVTLHRADACDRFGGRYALPDEDAGAPVAAVLAGAGDD